MAVLASALRGDGGGRVSLSVRVNGARRELPDGSTIASVVQELTGRSEGRGVAVALEGEVVPRGRWPETELAEGAEIEVVAAVQGG
jgi:sulfur carrier protein